MSQRLNAVFAHWLPLGVAIILLGGFTYGAIQQTYRQGLNDPQIQMVEDAQTALQAGEIPAGVVPRGELFDAGKSLAPFIAVYDADGNPLEASAHVNGEPPKPPLGVFEAAKVNGENRVTWQPAPGTRIALVVRPVLNESGRFVAAGRNMREAESRVNSLSSMTLLAILVTLILTFLLDLLSDAIRRRHARVSST